MQLAKFVVKQIPDRAAVYEIATGTQHIDLGGFRYFEYATSSIPMHTLPHSIVRFPFLLSSCLQQMREKIEQAIRRHRQMDADQFNDLFRTLHEMTNSLEQAWLELKKAVDVTAATIPSGY